ncbi:MAG: ABC transporter permease [Thermodesulfobacteriota bacterium]|nr:MAG: ABC transporter permease [Thermodesulfobacteriota bacterium]
MKILSAALRNVGRNRHRTIVTTLAMAFAGLVMIFYVSLMNGMFSMLEKNIVSMDLGDIQIHAPGYLDDPDLYNRIMGFEKVIGKVEKKGFFASPRLYGYALGATERTSSGVVLTGVDPAREDRVTELYRHISKGEWLDPKDPGGVVIGSKLSGILDRGPGDEIVVVGQASDGSMANEVYHVRGVLKAVGQAIDSSSLFMTSGAFRSLMVLPEGVHEIALSRVSKDMDLAQATLAARSAAKGLDVKNWRELRPLVARLFDVSVYSTYFMYIVTYAAIGIVISNATLMSVFERIHELGLLKALGVGPGRIAAMVFTETIIQAAGAGALAVAAGLPLSLYFEAHGINLTRVVGSASLYGVAIDPVWYSVVTARSVVEPVIFLIAMVIAGVIYPVVKAARLTPLEALYYR